MKVALVMVSSLNGKITRGTSPRIHNWTSKEDQVFFTSLVKKYKVIVMGSKTYEAARAQIKPNKKIRRIIVTRHPDKYKNEVIPGKIEFSKESPEVLVKKLTKEGYKEMLLVGGGELNKAFFAADLITDFFLTLEPKLFGQGRPVVADGEYETEFSLKSVKKLNPEGTLLLHYVR